MSVAAATTAELKRLIRTQLNLPTGYWQSSSTVAGDGSAGSATITITIPSQGVDNAYASVEEIAASTTATADVLRAAMVWNNYRAAPSSFELARVADVTGIAVVNTLRYGYWYPFHLIEKWLDTPADHTLTVDGSNPGALNQMRVNAWGFVWDVQAFKFAGGPVRPFGGYRPARSGALGGP